MQKLWFGLEVKIIFCEYEHHKEKKLAVFKIKIVIIHFKLELRLARDLASM